MFSLQCFFNPYLGAGNTRLDAVLTVSSNVAVAATQSAGKRAVGFIMDVSGSMAGEKLAQAKLAARRGIDLLSEDTWFFVVTFSGAAQLLVPPCQATANNKFAAHQRIQDAKASGSTAMSRALARALDAVQASGADIASVYLLTDGQNDNNDTAHLPDVLEACQGKFQCDCRGVGTDWQPSELRRVSAALLGSADAITDAAGLEEDFKGFLARSMGKSIARAVLRLTSPRIVKLVTVKQVSPEIVDQLPLAVRLDEKTTEIPLGSWGAETRDYQLAFELPANAVGEEMLVCRPSIVAGSEAPIACAPVAVKWSADDVLTTRISKEVAHYNGQSELAAVIQEGLEAQGHGDEDRATRLLGRAAQIAEQSGNEEVTRRLKKVVDVVDAAAGTVRLRKADKAAAMELEMGGTRTVRRRGAASAAPTSN